MNRECGLWQGFYAHTWQGRSSDCGFGILDIGFGILDLVFKPVSMECGVLVDLARPHLARDVS